ncbi:hypothetical protein MPSEU_000617900 [Mayamaea pseudoterrestris]|nr:hypothetical protein MPSEU_000617900 [Mayamaea pseudoterrestris]
MLPSHYHPARDSADCPPNRRLNDSSSATPPSSRQLPPLGLTGVLCESRSITLPHGTLQCTIFRPRHLKYKPPLICVAGGPLLPCTYLSPLAHLVTDRAIVLYDAIGCGQSSANNRHANPKQTKQIVDNMVLELQTLISEIQCDDYYLFGHSFGGAIVYEYLKQQLMAKDSSGNSKTCLGTILSSVPLSIEDSQAHCQELMNSIREELGPDAEQEDVSQVFHQRHECRKQPIPLPLQQAFQLAGYTSRSSSTAGLKAVSDYSIELLDNDTFSDKLPPALVLRGKYDFITLRSTHASS